MREGKRWRGKLAATAEKSTARSGCATKDRDAGLPGKSDRDTRTWKPGATKQTRRAGVASPATTRSDEKNGEVNLPLQQKKSTARSGCATKDAGLKPGATKTRSEEWRMG